MVGFDSLLLNGGEGGKYVGATYADRSEFLWISPPHNSTRVWWPGSTLGSNACKGNTMIIIIIVII